MKCWSRIRLSERIAGGEPLRAVFEPAGGIAPRPARLGARAVKPHRSYAVDVKV